MKSRGPHPHKRLTAIVARNARKPGRYADGNGLYLVVDESGARRWILRTIVLGRRRDIGLGSLRLIPLADAREEAARLRRVARSGGDPLAERRRDRRAVLTFKEAAEKVHASHAETFKNAKHSAQWLASLNAYVFPVFGGRSVDAIDSADILRALSPIWSRRPETARRVRQRIRVVLDWARAAGYRNGENPVTSVVQVLPKTRPSPKHHAALPHAQLPSFLDSVKSADAGKSVKLAFEFLILTATRTSEVLGARWSEIDRGSSTWNIPADRIKAGREHRIPLSTRSLEILSEAEAIRDGGPYVFPGRSPTATLSNMVFLMLLRRLDQEGITAHGFRSAFRDWAAERTTFPRAVCEAALAHVVKDRTEAAYFRSDLFDLRRSLLEQWSTYATTLPSADAPGS
jgi:integrase